MLLDMGLRRLWTITPLRLFLERMKTHSPRLAVRALILVDDRLLLVNAWPGGKSDLWCAPGGGVEPGTSLPDNLAREVHEETGLDISVGDPALVNEFHDPASGFHQVDIYFRCTPAGGPMPPNWTDPEGIVTERRFFTRTEMAAIRFKPDSLATAAWGEGIFYDALEPIVR
jgi:ADP-ribose pyrophosphatase YjhB (NUDIX family)